MFIVMHQYIKANSLYVTTYLALNRILILNQYQSRRKEDHSPIFFKEHSLKGNRSNWKVGFDASSNIKVSLLKSEHSYEEIWAQRQL